MGGRQRPGRGERLVRRAWWSLILFVPSLVAAFLVGEGLLSAFGYDTGEDVPAEVALAAGLPAIVVFALPTLLVWRFGRRGEQAGAQDGWVPTLVALTLSGVFLAANLFQLVVGLLF